MVGGVNTQPWKLAGSLTALCVAALVGGGIVVAVGVQPEKIEPPKAFTPFTATDRSFQCEAPQGWKSSASASQATDAYASFSKGPARIRVSTDLASSLIADASRTPGGMDASGATGGEVPGGGSAPDVSNLPGLSQVPGAQEAMAAANRPPVEKAHLRYKQTVETKLAAWGFGDYEEKEMQTAQCKAGEGRISEFTAKGGIPAYQIHGYRFTALGRERGINVITYCPIKNWDQLKPAFQRVIGSVADGGS